MSKMQRALRLIYPDQCILCTDLTEQPGGLCAKCWSETPFLTGLICDVCGIGLPGEADGHRVLCDDCMKRPRAWKMGRAALSYRDGGKRLVLALKHGDRTDLAVPASLWMAEAGHEILTGSTVLVPIPVHWTRLLRRRYNQAIELARALSVRTGLKMQSDALIRARRTPSQDGLTTEERYENLMGAIQVNDRYKGDLENQTICLVDDVMTSGATLNVSTKALLAAGAAKVSVLVLARVEKSS